MVETNNRIRDLPPSAKLVLKVLEDNSGLTQKQIVNETRLPKRTVRDALGRLINGGFVEKNRYQKDARQNLYTISLSTYSETAEPSKA